MSTSFVCRSAIAFPYWTNDYFCVSFWETRLRFPFWKMTILVILQFEKKLRIRKKFPGNREIWKSADSEISDFSLYSYNRKFWICNTPPLIFLRNPAILPFIFKKGVDTKISAESIMQNGRVHNTEWGESVMQSGKVYKAWCQPL